MKEKFIRHIIMALSLAFILFIGCVQTAFAAFPTDWHFRKSHVINLAAGAGADYQVRITANYGAGTDSGENVYLNSNCRTDFQDIRFVSSDGVTELNYWMETGSLATGVSAIFWVKVADNLDSADQTIYVYYGNPTATTTSDGNSAFIFFDDFDVDLAKWVKEKEITPGVITLNAPSSYVRCGGGSTASPYGHTSLGSSPAYTGFTDGAIEVRMKESTNALAEIAYRGDFAANTGYKARYDCRTGSETPHMKPSYYGWVGFGTAVTRFGIGTDTWFRGTVAATTSGGLFTHRIFRNDVLMSTATDTEYPGPGEIALQNHYGSYSDYDWVAVRKFVYPEPVDGAWGAETPLQATVSATKSVVLSNDADGDGVITPGDTMRYNVKIYNTGNVAALGATLTDILPADMTYVASSVTATNGTASYNSGLNQIEWTGTVTADPTGVIKTIITFDVTVGAALGTVVSNQGTVSYDSDNDGVNDASVLTDGDPYGAGIQTTDFTVGGSAQATGIKTVTLAVDADGNGVITPGDTLEYTIAITNTTGFPSAGIEVADVIPPHTTYVTSSTTVTDRDGTYTISEPSPPTYPETLLITGMTIGPAGSGSDVITIKFRVLLDDPMASGVTQISNQAVGFYDSDSDGTNDTHQETDGDSGTIGNQPTVTDLYVGTISGTVFDDNGTGGGTAGDGTQNGAEPGISGVTVQLYDAAFTLLYGTDITDFAGYFVFTGLTPGAYGVRETDPTYYASTTPNDVSVTLATTPSTGDSAVVNYGDQANGDADLEISKICTSLLADGTDQLAFLITVTNNGPDAATNVVLTDDLTALAAAGLSNLNYTEDGGALTPWPGTNTLTWANMASGTSHIIRIYATVATDFVPEENTATVISDIFDSNVFNNTASCTNIVSTIGEGAMEFPPVTNSQITVASSASLNLTATGTIEAWIYPASFADDANIIGKGNNEHCYGFGLGGGVHAGDIYSGGTEQNICFAIFDTAGTKHILAADAYTISINQWYHVACTWSGAAPGNIDINIYINGILEASSTVVLANAVRTTNEDFIIGYQDFTHNNYEGIIDEVRVWDTARTQTRIQDTLCHKITASETDYADLMGNWRFDEDSGAVCNDSSAYDNIGISNTVRVCSSAPIGDASAYDYTGTAPAEFQVLNFTSAAYGDSMTVTGDGGEWNAALDSFLQVYRVDHAPTNVSQPFLWKNLEAVPHYWGVFKAGGTNPTYEAVYTYTGYPDVNNEESLKLAYRNHNCENWKGGNATLDTINETLTLSGLTGTEFLLGQNVDPRNTIDFDSTSSQYVQVADGGAATDLDPTTAGAIEAWINLSSYQSNAGIIHKGDGTTDSYSLYMGTGASSNILYFTVDDGSTPVVINSTITLNLNTWYHVAGTWDGTNMVLYINGILETTTGTTIAAQDSAGPLYIGARQTAGPSYFDGNIDEVRVWTTNRTQTDIRDYMCQKLIGSESGLGGYWRFDEETTSTTTPDYDFGTANDGTMFGFGTAGDVITARTCSAAPIGDDSAYDYTATTTSANLAHPDGDDMTAAQFAGNWATTYTGIQVYRIDEAPVYSPDIYGPLPYNPYTTPNGLTPPATWSSVDYYRYWGVFVTDWINTPSYQVVYDYGSNPSVPTDETELGLAIRDQYCDRTWADSAATLNTVANTLTHSNETIIDEYVLGGKANPLAIALASFYAEFDKSSDCIRVTWKTATEIDTIGFQLWRSDTKEGPYTLLSDSFTPSAALSETTGAAYSYSDCGADLDTYMTFYYKLEEIDMDTAKDNPVYGPIGPVTETIGASQLDRNNTSSSKSGGGCFIDSLNQ